MFFTLGNVFECEKKKKSAGMRENESEESLVRMIERNVRENRIRDGNTNKRQSAE